MNEDTSLTPSSDVKRKFNAPKYDIGSVVEFKYKISKTLFLGFHGYLSFKNLIHQDGEVLLAKHQFLVNVYYKLYEHSNDGE